MALCGIPKTFKQQVEEIARDSISRFSCKYTPCNGQSCEKCAVDRILSAHNAELDRIAEGMPKGLAEDDGTDWQLGVRHGIQCQYNECQAYIQAQKGS